MTRTALAVSLAFLVGACGSDDAKTDGVVGSDTPKYDKGTTPTPDKGTTPTPDKGTTPTPDGPKKEGVPPSQPGTVCTQQNQTCPSGQICAFLEAWNAPKGTCMTELKDGCKSWDDARCKVAGANYSVMCGPYSWNSISTNICFLLCKWNNTTYDCPPNHTCKLLSNGYNVCLPQ